MTFGECIVGEREIDISLAAASDTTEETGWALNRLKFFEGDFLGGIEGDFGEFGAGLRSRGVRKLRKASVWLVLGGKALLG